MIAVVEDRNDLPRWLLSAVVVIGIHAALAVTLTRWHEPLAGDEGTEAIVVDLAPFTAPPTESRNDLAPGPEQQQSTAPPDAQPLKPEEKQEKIELPPPVPDADVQLPAEPVKPPNKPDRATKSARRGNIAATAKAVGSASCLLASQDCSAGGAQQRLSGFGAGTPRDRNR